MKRFINNIKIDLTYYFHTKYILAVILTAIIFAFMQINLGNDVTNMHLEYYEESYEYTEKKGLNPEVIQYQKSGIEDQLFSPSQSIEGDELSDYLPAYHQIAEANLFKLSPKPFMAKFINNNGYGIVVLIISIIICLSFGSDYDSKIIKLRAANNNNNKLIISKFISTIIIIVITMMTFLITVYLLALFNYMSFNNRGVLIQMHLFDDYKYNIFNGILLMSFNVILYTSIIQFLIILFKNRIMPIILFVTYTFIPAFSVNEYKVLAQDLFSYNQLNGQSQDYTIITDYTSNELLLILTGFIIILYLGSILIFNKQSKYLT